MTNQTANGMMNNNEYKTIVYSFMEQARVLGHSIDGLELLGAILYLAKKHIIVDTRSISELLASDSVSQNADVALDVARTILVSKLHWFKNIGFDNNLGKISSRIDSILGLPVEEYSTIFENAMEMWASVPSAKDGIFFQPRELTDIVRKLITGSHLKVFNPFSGLASYAIAMDDYDTFTGMELDPEVFKISLLRLALANKLEKVSIIEGNVRNWTSKQFDVVVTTPPFAVKIAMAGNKNGDKELTDIVSLSRFESTTTANGQLCTVVRSSVLWSTANDIMNVRKSLIEKGFVEKIVMLPANIYYGSMIPLAIIYLNKNNEHQDSIELIDGTDCFVAGRGRNVIDVDTLEQRIDQDNENRLIVPISTIRDNLYALDYPRYKELADIVVPEGYKVYKLGELISAIQPIRHFAESSGRLVTVTAISDAPYDCMKKPTDFPETDNLRNAAKLSEPALVVSMIRNPKCCYIDASEEHPVFLNPNVRAFKVSLNVATPEYLCLQISKKNVSTIGVAIPCITLPILLAQRVVLPSLETQKSVYSERMQEDKLAKARELGLQDVIDKMKAEYINEVRMRKHDMRPYLRNIAAEEKLMRYFVENMQSQTDFATKMLQVLNNCRNDIKQLSILLDNLSKEEKFGAPEIVNIDKYLASFSIRQDTDKYTYYYDRDDDALNEAGLLEGLSEEEIDETLDRWKKDVGNDHPNYLTWDDVYPGEYPDIGPKLLVSIAPADLDRMVENIVSNSVNHGFTDPEREDYNICNTLSFDAKRNMFVIDFVDNGKPLPVGMDKERYGLKGEKAGATAGTGLGGSIVKEIVKHYGGDYDIFSNDRGTTVRIWLPLAKTEEN